MSKDFYQALADQINRTVSRKAVTAKEIDSLVRKAKRIRQTQGVFGLWNFASQLPSHFFTESEIERLRQSPEWFAFSRQFIQILIREGVITPWEARMIDRYI